MRLDQGIDLFIARGGHTKDVFGKAAGFGIHLVPRSPESFAHLVGAVLAYVSLKQHLHGKFPRLPPLAGGAHGVCNLRSSETISIAAMAASNPLLPALIPARF